MDLGFSYISSATRWPIKTLQTFEVISCYFLKLIILQGNTFLKSSTVIFLIRNQFFPLDSITIDYDTMQWPFQECSGRRVIIVNSFADGDFDEKRRKGKEQLNCKVTIITIIIIILLNVKPFSFYLYCCLSGWANGKQNRKRN